MEGSVKRSKKVKIWKGNYPWRIMEILSWNVRGCNTPNKRRLVKRGVDQAKRNIVMFQETNIKREDKVIFQEGWKAWQGSLVDVEGASSGLCILWKPKKIKGEELI